MKNFEYVYFIIYQYSSRQGYYTDGLIDRLKCMYALSLSVGGWILFLQLLILRFVTNMWFNSHPGAMLYALTIYTMITILFHHIFITKEVDQKIIAKYSSAWNNNPNKQRDMHIALFVAAVPYISMFSIKVFFPR